MCELNSMMLCVCGCVPPKNTPCSVCLCACVCVLLCYTYIAFTVEAFRIFVGWAVLWRIICGSAAIICAMFVLVLNKYLVRRASPVAL